MGAMSDWSLTVEEVELARDAWEAADWQREQAVRAECEARIRYDKARAELARLMGREVPEPLPACKLCGKPIADHEDTHVDFQDMHHACGEDYVSEHAANVGDAAYDRWREEGRVTR